MLYLQVGASLHLQDTVKANGVNIKVNNNSNPEIQDWDEDGKKDLIVGEESFLAPNTGNIRVYLNSGTNANPVFTTYTCVEAGGSQIYQFRVTPRIVDLDLDGKKDLLVGQGDGLVLFFRNVGTNAAPVFNATYDTLKQENGVPVDAYYGSRIFFNDWTGDGDLDLLVSGYDGYIELFENTTDTKIEETGCSAVTSITVQPNPFSTGTSISYTLDKPGRVTVSVYAIDGQFICCLSDAYRSAGVNHCTWNGSPDGVNLPAGVYVLTIKSGRGSYTRRMIVVR